MKHLSTCEDIVTADKACMVSSISYYVNSASYHKHMVVGAKRIDLNGEPTGEVSAEEAKYAEQTRHAKFDKKKPVVQSDTTPTGSD